MVLKKLGDAIAVSGVLSVDALWHGEVFNPDISTGSTGRGWKVVPLAQLMIIASHLIRLAGRILEPPRDCKLPTVAMPPLDESGKDCSAQ